MAGYLVAMPARTAPSRARHVAGLATMACLASASCGGEVVHDGAPGAVPTQEPERIPCPPPEPTPAGPPCDSAADCSDDTYCDFADDLCGQGSRGTCVPEEIGCEFDRQEACTCGGAVASNACVATWAGADVSMLGDCPLEEGQFRCGWRLCQTALQYCRLTDTSPWSAECPGLPDRCDPASSGCGCLSEVQCGSSCEGSLAVGLTVRCVCE